MNWELARDCDPTNHFRLLETRVPWRGAAKGFFLAGRRPCDKLRARLGKAQIRPNDVIASFKDIHLKILVFGPNPSIPHPAGFMADLAAKRKEIRDALISDGHQAVFPEDLSHGPIDPAIDNAYLWEQILVREYDMVVNLVGSIGAVAELSLFMREHLALKAALFFNADHTTGIAFQQARAIEAIGARLHTYVYPSDLASCNLMKEIRKKVWAVRVGKFMAP